MRWKVITGIAENRVEVFTMQTHNYLLAALDMDGTLLNTEHISTPRTREALRRAAEAGRITALATGRCLSELRQHLGNFAAVRYLISENGACIYDAWEERCLCRTPISAEDIEFIIELCGQYDMICEFFIGDQAYMRWNEPDDFTPYHIEDFRSVFHVGCVFDLDMFENYHRNGLPVDKVNLFFRTGEAREHMRAILQTRDLVIANSIGLGLEMSKGGVTKAAGLRMLCDCLNIPICETIAVGDGWNDVEILQAAGLGVAMGNAAPEVKAAADAVTEDCDHDGAALAIERYMLALSNASA